VVVVNVDGNLASFMPTCAQLKIPSTNVGKHHLGFPTKFSLGKKRKLSMLQIL
jgi:hypothetical protein